MPSACAVLPVRLYHIFPHYLVNGKVFGKKITEQNADFNFRKKKVTEQKADFDFRKKKLLNKRRILIFGKKKSY